MAESEAQYKPPVMYSDGKAEWPIDPNTGVPTPKAVPINSDTDALKNNLDWATRAVEWSNRNIRLASNRTADVLMSPAGSTVCVAWMRHVYNKESQATDAIGKIRERAKIAARYGCGNCEEMSSTAFIWLYDYYLSTNKNATLAWMAVTNGDHLFVLIGFPEGKGKDWNAWGPRSVVADPWNRQVYPADKIRTTRWMAGHEVYTPLIELPVPRRREVYL